MNIVRLMLLSRQMKNRRHEKDNMVTGIPPLTFTANKTGMLKNYRIYGQTSRNLFNFNTVTNGYRITWATGALISDETAIMSDFIPVKENVYQINIQAFVACYNSEKNYLGIYSSNGYIKDYSNAVNSFTIDNNCKYVRIFTFRNKSTPVALTQETMLNSGSTLLPYEPYGESVGDRTGNLFDGVLNDNIGNDVNTGLPISHNGRVSTDLINTIGDTLILTYNSDDIAFLYSVFNGNTLIRRITVKESARLRSGDNLDVSGGNSVYICFLKYSENQVVDISSSDISNIMLNTGSTALPYEPYGYKVPVTINDVTTNLYLPEPIKMVGDEAEYIDYAEQKFHRISGADLDVTLPALPVLPGTNTLTVGTEVQPSRVELTGRIKEAQTNGSGNT